MNRGHASPVAPERYRDGSVREGARVVPRLPPPPKPHPCARYGRHLTATNPQMHACVRCGRPMDSPIPGVPPRLDVLIHPDKFGPLQAT